MAFSESLDFGNSTFMNLENQVNHAINKNDVEEEVASITGMKPVDIIDDSPTKFHKTLNRTRSRLMGATTSVSYKQSKFRKCKSDSILNVTIKENPQRQDNYSDFFRNDFTIEMQEGKLIKSSVKEELASPIAIVESMLEAAFAEEFSIENPTEQHDTNISIHSGDFSNISAKDVPIFSEDFNEISGCANKPTADEHAADMWQDPSAFDGLEMQVSATIENAVAAEEIQNIDECSFVISTGSNEEHKFVNKELQLSKQEVMVNIEKIDKTFISKDATISNNSSHHRETPPSAPKYSASKPKLLLNNTEELKNISSWNLPVSVLREYEKKGIHKMFDWQIECLSNPKVLFEHCNLVYSAPTSAGKTLVSEILLIKTILERGKKVILILPFISVVREKMFYLQDLLTSSGYRVEGFFGGYTPPGGFDSIHVAICTIEKANSIVNKLMEQGKLDEIGNIVVDEVHLISDPGRGYILELLLAKILYMSRKHGLQIQVITMSATLANVELLKQWLDAELYVTQFRPVALQEMIKIGTKIYNCSDMKELRELNANETYAILQNDSDHVAQLCIETLLEGCSVVVFCPSKDWCEKLAVQLAGAIYAIGKSGTELGARLRTFIKREAIDETKKQLRDIPTGLDAVLERTITYACAFHHAGLTTEERDIVESSFKMGILKIIVATSTLSSGVNLPARRVLIRSPLFGGKQMSSLTYRQMIGRAGRTGKDILGESILICTESNARVGRELVSADLKPIASCLEMESSAHLKRALLEVISSGVATTLQDILNFVKCTLLSAQKDMHDNEKNVESQLNDDKNDENILPDYIKESLEFLLEYEFIRLQLNEETNTKNYMATRLGLACLASSMPPSDGLILFSELQKSRRCFVLESELHAVYLVTPYSVCYQMQDIDWLLYLDMWEKLTPSMKKVGELVGVKESFLVRAMRGQTKLDYKLMQIHKRFYTALALQELVNETPITQVALKYNCTRGMLQSLQQMSSTFAGIVTAFCNSLHWSTLSLIVSQFKERLFFGIHHELIDLMRLPDLNQKRARALYDAGITSLIELANCNEFTLQKVLFNAISFDSAKQLDNENELETNRRNLERHFFITGKTGLTLSEAAKLLVQEARLFVQHEIGVGNINWSQKSNDNEELLHMSYEPINELKTVNEREKRKPDAELKSPPKLFKGTENENLTNSKEAIISKTKQIPNADLSTKNQTENKMESIPSDDVRPNTKNSNKENLKSQQLNKIKNNNSFPKPKLPVEHKTPLANKELSTKQNNKNEVLKAQPITSKAVEPRRSPRNHMQKLQNSNERNLSKKTAFSKDIELLMADESFEINSGIAKKLKNENKKSSPIKSCVSSPANENANSEEILSSQKTPVENIDTPRVSRLLRSYRLASPKTQLNPPITSDQDIANAPEQNQTPTSSFEYAVESMAESSLIMNPKNLNASHILSCSKEDPEAVALCFQSVDVIDICGNTTLFKNAFKTLMSTKRIGISVGLQMDANKRKPLIGANLLINQVGAADNSSMSEDVQFCLDDHTYCTGIAFSIADNCIFYMNMQDEETCKDLTKEIKCEYIRMLLKSQNHTLLIYDAKEQLKVLRKAITNLVDICVNLEDPKVANWLLQPDRTSSFGNLAQQFAPECTALVNLCGSGRGYNSIGLDADSAILAKVRSSIEACVTIHILKGQIENLERIGNGQLHKFFRELEMPMQLSLCNMEIYGFPTNTLELHKLSQQMVDAMKKVESKIYELNGSRFNLGSSSAVAKVVGLHHRNSNGRISTSRQILEKVDSPMTQFIVLYRKLSATLTKNIQPLLKCVVDNRIHGQSITFTSTGRISMTEPNLQNVAKDFTVELEKEKIQISCRKAFSPIDDKSCLISSDFCQLEMRILAHLSQDPTLLRVMHSENDVFTAIAARWNNIPEDNVSEQLRNGTKQICYGIVYGMGMRSLAEALKCTEKEALSVSEQFHAAYPGIRVYADKIIKFARNNGYIETITGRRRYLDHINSSETHLKSQAERQAVNSTIQGSAADIAKSAIIRIEKNISKYCEKLGISMKSVQLVLHLHDELIFEVPEEKAKKIAKLLSVTMENCVKLSVPLKVKLRIGKTWGSLKEVKL